MLKLGIDIAQSTVAKYMPRRRGTPSPGWRAFLRNHTAHIAAIDLFVIPTIGFRLVYGLVILRLKRRRLVWTNVTANPTAEWIARQITEAFPWDTAPRYLIRDRYTAYGVAVTRRLRAMGFRDRPITPRSPWQNGHVERLKRRWSLDEITRFEQVRVLDPQPSATLLAEGWTHLSRAFPAFAQARIAERWGGLIDATPDAVPVISSVAALPGFFLATGFSGHGFGLGPAAGRLAADLVAGDRPLVDPFAFARFQLATGGTGIATGPEQSGI